MSIYIGNNSITPNQNIDSIYLGNKKIYEKTKIEYIIKNGYINPKYVLDDTCFSNNSPSGYPFNGTITVGQMGFTDISDKYIIIFCNSFGSRQSGIDRPTYKRMTINNIDPKFNGKNVYLDFFYAEGKNKHGVYLKAGHPSQYYYCGVLMPSILSHGIWSTSIGSITNIIKVFHNRSDKTNSISYGTSFNNQNLGDVEYKWNTSDSLLYGKIEDGRFIKDIIGYQMDAVSANYSFEINISNLYIAD